MSTRTKSPPGGPSAQSDPPDVLASTAFLLARLGRVAGRRLNDHLAITGLRPPHAAILIELCAFGPMSQQSLGERLQVDPSNLVGFLNALEEDGLVIRRRAPDDRRRHIVEATEKGVARLPACDRPVDAVEDQLLAGLSPAERRQLHGLLGRILVTMSIDELGPDGDGAARRPREARPR
jgi:DNA-binding MarR family transcriptional regulator